MEKAKILLVEDNADLAALIQKLLEYLGLSSSVAANGPDAVKIALEEKPDLIILDIALPLMSGFEVASRLKNDASTRSIPILAVTGLAMPRDREMCLRNGCDGYLAKPFQLAELKAEIDRLLSPRAAG